MNSVNRLTAGDLPVVGTRGKADPTVPATDDAPDLVDQFSSILARLDSARTRSPPPGEVEARARPEGTPIEDGLPRAFAEPEAIDGLTRDRIPLPDVVLAPGADGGAANAGPAAGGGKRRPPPEEAEGDVTGAVAAIRVAVVDDRPSPQGPATGAAANANPPPIAGQALSPQVADAPPANRETARTAPVTPATGETTSPPGRAEEARAWRADASEPAVNQTDIKHADDRNEKAARTKTGPPRATVVGFQTHFAPARPAPAAIARAAGPTPRSGPPTVADGQVPAGRSAVEPSPPGPINETIEATADAGPFNVDRPDIEPAPRRPAKSIEAPVMPAFAAEATASPSTEPGLTPPTLQKITGAIVEAAGAPQAATRLTTAAPPTSGTGDWAAPPPLRVLTVRLDLPDHGGLDVRLSLTGNGLSLRLRAEREETAHRLRADLDQLTALLRDAGYDADIAAIEARRAEPAPTARLDPAASQAQGNGGPTGNANPGQPGAQDRSPPPSRSAHDPSPPGEAPARDEINRAADRPGALYV